MQRRKQSGRRVTAFNFAGEVRMRLWKLLSLVGFGISFAVASGRITQAQTPPWDEFQDVFTGQICDLINAGNAELVVFSDTGELVVITGTDVFFDGSFVDLDGTVFLDGFPFGIIDFATDGDGFRTLWWMTLTGTAVDIDPFTFGLSDSGLFPSDFASVPCEACPFWDEPFVCDGAVIIDSDLDGIPDVIDLCPDTLVGADVDFDGCACFDFDTDADGVDDCDDLCPNTPFNTDVDLDGCSVVVVVQPPPIFISCGNLGSFTLAMTFCGLASMRFIGRRPRRVNATMAKVELGAEYSTGRSAIAELRRSDRSSS